MKDRSPKIRRAGLCNLWFEPLEVRTLLSAAGALQQAYGQLPLSFEVNDGQTASQVQYLSQGNGYALFLTETSAVLSLTEAPVSTPGSTPPTSTTGVALAMNLVRASPQATVSGLDQQAGVSNYFIGNDPSQWHTNVANYGQVEYQNVYSGINLVYYGNQQQLEYDFDVAPGADPGQIQFAIQGADSISLDDQGNLVLHTALGDVQENAPVIYQEVGGVQQPVSGQFVLLGNNEVGFQVGAYDASLPLTIDPVLSYSTYLGGNDNGTGIAVDGSGDAYVTGEANSTNFPTTAGAFQTTFGGGSDDAFVTKLNASGTALVYSTYLGGNNNEYGSAIAVDGLGNAYVTGATESTNFPTTAGAFQTTLAGTENAFVAKLNASGTALVYSTYLGAGNNQDQSGNGIAVDGSGNAYVTGETDSNFPVTTGAFQTTFGGSGNYHAFVTKLNASGTALVYSTYLEGNVSDYGFAIAVDGSGNAYVTGNTSSTNFPTTPGAFQTTLAGTSSAFVTKLNASGTALLYSTYLGGNNGDYGFGIALDGSGNAYITGETDSTNFPTTPGAFLTSFGGGDSNAFVTKLNASGTVLVYSTYLGGNTYDSGTGIAVDASGNAYVTGVTSSSNFPTTADAIQTNYGGGVLDNAFVTKLNASGTALDYSTYLTGNTYDGSQDGGYGIAVDASDNAYVTGDTSSTNFPTTAGAYQTSLAGAEDAFVAKLALANTDWDQFNGNAQHTGISTVAAGPTDHILWSTSVSLAGGYFWHTGEPVFTPNDTVIVPVQVTSNGTTANAENYELEAFNGVTGSLLWTTPSYYVAASAGWTPPYQPIYDPVTNRVYFAGPGGTLYYISNPDNPGSATPTPVQVAFYGTANYTANESTYNSSIHIDTPLTVDNAGDVFFGFQETGSNPSGINDGGIGRVNATGAGTYVTTGVAVGVGSGYPAYGSAPALSNDDSILYVAMDDSNGSYLVGVNASTLAHTYSVAVSVPNSGTGVYFHGDSTAAPMVAPDGTVFMGVFANSYDGSRGFMTHYSANLATEYTPGAFGWDDTASIIPTSMVPSYTGSSPYLILTKYNNYVAAETGSTGGNGVNEIAILDPYATQTDSRNDPNPNLQVMKEVMTVTSPTEDSGYINSGYPDATREWCTNGTAVDPASDSVFINNEDGYSYRWNLATNTITQAVDITNGYGEPYTPTSIGPNGVVYALNGGTLFALGGYSNYTLTNVSSLTPAVVGQSVTFTTTLASTNGGAVPTGSITYSYTSGINTQQNSTPVTLGTVPLVNGQASYTTSALVPNHYHIIASYSGDATDGYAAGSTTLVQVVRANPITSVSSSASPSVTGQSVTFTATVNPNGIFFVPLGTVSFMDGSTLLGTVTLNPLDQSTSPSSSQTATFTTSSLAAGSHSITVVYSGDLNFAGNTSSPITQLVLIPTTTTLTDNGPSPSIVGQSVDFTVTVSPQVPNGETVTLKDASNGNAVVGTGTLTAGSVNINVSSLSSGTHNIFAVYAGDTTYNTSQSSTVSQVVNPIQVTSVVTNGDYMPAVGASESGNTVTLITDGNSGFSAGNPIVVAGFSTTGYNGTWTITAVSGNTVQYTDSNSGLVATANNNQTTSYAISANTSSDLGPGLGSNNQRSMVDSIVYTFNTPVNLAANAFTMGVLTPSTVGPAVPATGDPNYALTTPDGGTTWVVTWASSATNTVSGHSIADGVYTITLNSSAVTAVSGGSTMTTTRPTDTFYRLYGDFNGAKKVNGTSANKFNSTLNLNNGGAGYLAYFDYNSDGKINGTDSNQLNGRLNSTWSNFTPTI